MKKLLSSVAFAALLTSAAHSADAVVEPAAPPAAPVAAYDWTGLYVGGTLGYGWGSYTPFDATGNGPSIDVDNFLYGGLIGYNWQHNNLVFGLEADIQNGPDGITAQGTSGPTWSCNTGDCNADINYWGSVRGRLGFAHNEWLFYGTGGWAYGDVDGGIFNSDQQGGGSADGWAAGAGIEWGYQNWSARVEYLHVDLGDIPFGTGSGSNPFKGDGDFDVVRFGVTYRFNFLNP